MSRIPKTDATIFRDGLKLRAPFHDARLFTGPHLDWAVSKVADLHENPGTLDALWPGPPIRLGAEDSPCRVAVRPSLRLVRGEDGSVTGQIEMVAA